jgi:hypothetical protein
VDGKEKAQAMMEQIAKGKPGKYFPWHVMENCEVSSIDTSPTVKDPPGQIPTRP